MKDVVTAEDVLAAPPGGEVLASAGAIVTPWAREVAATRNVRIVLGAAGPGPSTVALGADHGGFALKEEIKFLTEIFRLLAILTLAVGGGTISLVLGEYTVLKVVFAAIGIAASIGFIMALYRLQSYIRNLIKQLKED